MRLNCAEFHSKEPTEGMIIDLVRNNEKRGDHTWRARHQWETSLVGAGLSAGVAIAVVALLAVVVGACKFVLKLF